MGRLTAAGAILRKRVACAALVGVLLGAGCAGDKSAEVERVTATGESHVPGVTFPPSITLDSGKHFERVVALLPWPLPEPVPVVLPEMMSEATSSRTCFSVTLEVELSDGQGVSYQGCDFPRTVLRACAALSTSLPTAYRCPTAQPGSAFSIDPAVEPELRPRDVARTVRQELGDGSQIEQAVALPSDVTSCGFVGGCPPEPRSGAPRPVWFVIAYDDEGLIAAPLYLIVEDATGEVIARRATDDRTRVGG